MTKPIHYLKSIRFPDGAFKDALEVFDILVQQQHIKLQEPLQRYDTLDINDLVYRVTPSDWSINRTSSVSHVLTLVFAAAYDHVFDTNMHLDHYNVLFYTWCYHVRHYLARQMWGSK